MDTTYRGGNFGLIVTRMLFESGFYGANMGLSAKKVDEIGVGKHYMPK